ncbi:MAG: hypothetical protein R3F34_14095 [Planctomycetota bacterium]
MKRFAATVDDLLRGRLTRREDLAAGRIEVPVRTLVLAGVFLGGLYGAAMGLFAAVRPEGTNVAQLFASAIKVPLLFLLTLVVTYPSLYVVSALFDSRLRHRETLRLLLAAMAANLALLASLGPITAFFTLCTESYAFMVVLNVVFFALAGLVGLAFLRRAVLAVFDVGAPVAVPDDDDGPPPLDGPPRTMRATTPVSLRVFSIWLLIYGVVGAQMGWILRPFVGAPRLPFEFFRSERDSNFFEAVAKALGKLFA